MQLKLSYGLIFIFLNVKLEIFAEGSVKKFEKLYEGFNRFLENVASLEGFDEDSGRV